MDEIEEPRRDIGGQRCALSSQLTLALVGWHHLGVDLWSRWCPDPSTTGDRIDTGRVLCAGSRN